MCTGYTVKQYIRSVYKAGALASTHRKGTKSLEKYYKTNKDDF